MEDETFKKILIISKQPMKFNNNFLFREEVLSGNYLTYFNNDIQYGSKYILKRFLDIVLGSIAIVFFSPIMILLALYIFYLDGGPTVIRQNRVGLHGVQFSMYKFRTMKNNAHELRADLEELNRNDKAVLKDRHYCLSINLDQDVRPAINFVTTMKILIISLINQPANEKIDHISQ